MMILPKSVEWRLVGQNQQQWTEVKSVDKVLDTDTGTGEGAPGVNAQLTAPVSTAGSPVIAPVNSVVGMSVGLTVSVDTGAAQEEVVITAISGVPPTFTAVFSQLHGVNAIVTTSPAGVESDDSTVESYEWRGGILKLSPSSVAVDLRIRFVATAIPPTLDNNSQQFIIGLTNVYVYKCCVKICAARGVGTNALVQFFTAEYNRACADFEGLSVKAQQAKIMRLGGRRSQWDSGWNDGGWGAPVVNNEIVIAGGGSMLMFYPLTPPPNGVITVFTASVGISVNSFVIRNGLIQALNTDYTFAGENVTFFVAPGTGDLLGLYQ